MNHSIYVDQHLYFSYGNEKIIVERAKKFRMDNKVIIKVHPQRRVIVSSAENIPECVILKVLHKNNQWIIKQLNQFSQIYKRRTVDEGPYSYLGTSYIVKINIVDQIQSVQLLDDKIEVNTQTVNNIQTLLHYWYKDQAKIVFLNRLQMMLKLSPWIKSIPRLKIRTMKTRWGSCSKSGSISLNQHLIKAPIECIDFVIMHELCHFQEHNHSKRFYQLLDYSMPLWQSIKKKLDHLTFEIIC